MMRLAAATACLSTAIRCFTNNSLELGLPHWVWIIASIGWIYFALRIAIWGTEK